MQTLSYTDNTANNTANNIANNGSKPFSAVGRELTNIELEAVSGGNYNASLGAAVSLVVAGAALAGAAPLIGGALILGSIGASGVAIFSAWHRLDEKS